MGCIGLMELLEIRVDWSTIAVSGRKRRWWEWPLLTMMWMSGLVVLNVVIGDLLFLLFRLFGSE